MRPPHLQLAAALVCLLTWRTRASPASCVGAPSGSGFACSTAPQVVLRPNSSADDAEGRHLWLDADNETLCACTLTPVAKCCPPGSALDAHRCVRASVEFRPVINGPDGNLSLTLYRAVEMQCGESMPLLLRSRNYVGVTAAGQLQIAVPEAQLVEPGHFCLEINLDGADQVAVACMDRSWPQSQYVALTVVLVVCAFVMLATVVAHLALPKLQTPHGRFVCCYALSHLLSYLAFISLQLASSSVTVVLCNTLAFIAYFSYLSSFFWLNVMAFDAFWTFSGYRSMSQSGRGRNQKKFIIYCVYSWGCPLIFLGVALVMQYKNNIPEGLLRPQFGVQKCWFPDDKFTSLAYFQGPAGVLIMCNIVLFTVTVIRTRQFEREGSILNSSDSERHYDDNTKRFNTYLMLFIFMSVSSLVAMVLEFVDIPGDVLYATNICTTLEGVFVSVIYMWKVRIRRTIMEELCRKRAPGEPVKSTMKTYSPGIKTTIMEMQQTELSCTLENKT